VGWRQAGWSGAGCLRLGQYTLGAVCDSGRCSPGSAPGRPCGRGGKWWRGRLPPAL